MDFVVIIHLLLKSLADVWVSVQAAWYPEDYLADETTKLQRLKMGSFLNPRDLLPRAMVQRRCPSSRVMSFARCRTVEVWSVGEGWCGREGRGQSRVGYSYLYCFQLRITRTLITVPQSTCESQRFCINFNPEHFFLTVLLFESYRPRLHAFLTSTSVEKNDFPSWDFPSSSFVLLLCFRYSCFATKPWDCKN